MKGMTVFIYLILFLWIAASSNRLLNLCWVRRKFPFRDASLNGLREPDELLGNSASAYKSNSICRMRESDAPIFLVLIPLLREQELVSEIVEYFETISYAKKYLFVVFVTTIREQQVNLNKPTTAELIEKELSKNDCLSRSHFKHYSTDGSDRCKGDQLNQALDSFFEENPDIDCSKLYVGVYDADSRPDPLVLRYLANYISNFLLMHGSYPPVFQQIPIYFRNVSQDWNLKSIFTNSRALHNLDFAMTREIPAMQASVDYASRSNWRAFTTAWLIHLIGHGEFIYFPVLHKVGRFRSPSADTSLGYVLSYLGFPIIPVPLFDVSDTPKELRTLVTQGATWYRGVSLYWRDLMFSRTVGTVNVAKSIVMIVKVIYNNLAWSTFPIFILFVVFLAILSDDTSLRFLACFSLLYYLLPNFVQIAEYPLIRKRVSEYCYLSKLSFSYRVVLLLAYPCVKVFSTLGPWLHFLRQLKSLLGFNVSYQKTERVKLRKSLHKR